MKSFISRVLCFGMAVSILFTSLAVVPVTAQDNIKVVLNGAELTFDVPPQLIQGRTMVPMRKIFEAFGTAVDWDEATQTVTALKGEITITMQIGNSTIWVSGKEIILDVPPQLVGERTLVPVRAVAEGLDAKVEWDSDTQTVHITKQDTPVKPARYPEEGAMFGYGNDGIAELQYNARYLFEQKTIPETIFEYEKETIEYINTSNIEKMKENILGIWEAAAANVIFNDAELSGENPDINDEDAYWALSDERRPLYGLDDKHIINVTMEKIDTDTSAIVVELLDTGWTPLSTFVGIAYHKTQGLKYFTLERSIDLLGDGNVPYMFCQVSPAERKSIASIDNNKQAFLDAIREAMNSTEPDQKPDSSDGSAEINGEKCMLKATLTVMDMGNGDKAEINEGILTTAGVSILNDKGKNITSDLFFGKIEITKGSEVVTGNIDKKSNSTDQAYKFVSKWKPGEFADVSVEVKDEKGTLHTLSAKNVKIWDMAESLQNMLGPDVKVEIN